MATHVEKGRGEPPQRSWRRAAEKDMEKGRAPTERRRMRQAARTECENNTRQGPQRPRPDGARHVARNNKSTQFSNDLLELANTTLGNPKSDSNTPCCICVTIKKVGVGTVQTLPSFVFPSAPFPPPRIMVELSLLGARFLKSLDAFCSWVGDMCPQKPELGSLFMLEDAARAEHATLGTSMAGLGMR